MKIDFEQYEENFRSYGTPLSAMESSRSRSEKNFEDSPTLVSSAVTLASILCLFLLIITCIIIRLKCLLWRLINVFLTWELELGIKYFDRVCSIYHTCDRVWNRK